MPAFRPTSMTSAANYLTDFPLRCLIRWNRAIKLDFDYPSSQACSSDSWNSAKEPVICVPAGTVDDKIPLASTFSGHAPPVKDGSSDCVSSSCGGHRSLANNSHRDKTTISINCTPPMIIMFSTSSLSTAHGAGSHTGTFASPLARNETKRVLLSSPDCYTMFGGAWSECTIYHNGC
ncbi:hypothetical protein T10_691 [Trichinella papuae]|uniref:Uncharacterized protein n=1 Tax=Trichinella papuae TaxID=268474 RepID=A0A0V1N707_9BILA|nr:hypothetical protein T10_691 [Trichinella papuae]